MRNDSLSRFGKKKNVSKIVLTNRCVIYIRVSSLGQVDSYSLQNQLENCQRFAKNNNLEVVKTFDAQNESASKSERKSLEEVKSFCFDKANKVSYLIVNDLSRFSRQGNLAILLKEEFKQKGVIIIESSATSLKRSLQDDTFDDIKLIIAKNENQTRRQKCTEGILKRLQDGLWLSNPPRGYKKIDKTTLSFTKEAEFIKMAFKLKAKGYNNTQVMSKLKALGSSISKSRLPGYFTNIFYAGYIASSYLDGEVIKGRHEAIVSLDLFYEVNGLNSGVKYNRSGLQEERPLQGFVSCSCGSKYTGYKKKSKYNYYKCNGCKTNISSAILDDSFENLLNMYAFKELPIPLLKKQLRYTYDYIYQETIANNKYIKERITKLQKEFDAIELRFAKGVISDALFNKHGGNIKEQIKELEQELQGHPDNLSNSELYIDYFAEISRNIGSFWLNAPNEIKVDFQELVFSEGVVYDVTKEIYRTPRVNSLFLMTAGLTEKNKTGNNDENTNNSRSVPWVGIEPTLSKELDFESSASTNSATKAIKGSKLTIVSSPQKFLRFLIVH